MIRRLVAMVLSAVVFFSESGSCAAQHTRLLGQYVRVQLFDDGSHQTTWEIRSLNTSDDTLRVSSFRSSRNTLDRVVDAGGKEMRVETNRSGSGFDFTVHMVEPVSPGEEFTLIKHDRKIQLMRRVSGHWVYDMNHTPGPATEYTQTITLPAGAELISAVPSPTRQSEEGEITILFYEKQLQSQEAFRCEVRYRASHPRGWARLWSGAQ